jgi:hypothetical protein
LSCWFCLVAVRNRPNRFSFVGVGLFLRRIESVDEIVYQSRLLSLRVRDSQARVRVVGDRLGSFRFFAEYQELQPLWWHVVFRVRHGAPWITAFRLGLRLDGVGVLSETRISDWFLALHLWNVENRLEFECLGFRQLWVVDESETVRKDGFVVFRLRNGAVRIHTLVVGYLLHVFQSLAAGFCQVRILGIDLRCRTIVELHVHLGLGESRQQSVAARFRTTGEQLVALRICKGEQQHLGVGLLQLW